MIGCVVSSSLRPLQVFNESHTWPCRCGFVDTADVGRWQLAPRIDVCHEALDALPVQELVFGA